MPVSEPFAGQEYTLTCTANLLIEVSDTPIIMWMGPGVNSNGVTIERTSNRSVTCTSTLTFRPIREDHEGNYTCIATLNGIMSSVVVHVMGKLK